MNAIIFAAGKGTRMFPLSIDTPKPLIKIKGKPIIERTIETLISIEVKKITIVVGYLSHAFNYLVKKYKDRVQLINNDFYDKCNNISSFFVSKSYWKNTLYIEGDIYIKDVKKFKQVIKKQINQKDSICFGIKTLTNINEWKFNFDNKNRIINHSIPAYKGDYIWSGILFVNSKLAKEAEEKIDSFFKIVENRNLYFEQFFWTLDNKFFLKELPENISCELDYFHELLEVDSSYGFERNILMTPGPVNTPKPLSAKISGGIVHHRSKLAEYYIKECINKLKTVFKTNKANVLLLTASGTAGMEASIVNTIEKGDRVALIDTGDFSNRFKQILEIYEAKIFLIPSNDEDKMIEQLKSIKSLKAVISLHHETSNGTLINIKRIGEIFKEKDTLVIIDSISSLMVDEFYFDDWGIDIALGSSPKSFSLPPGLTYICISDKAKKIIEKNKNKKFYFDFNLYFEYYEKYSQTPFTPAISLIISTIESIKLFSTKKDYKKMNDYLYRELLDLGFVMFNPNVKHSFASVCLLTPNKINASDLRTYVSNHAGIYFELGRAELRNKMIRIGLLGNISMTHCKKLVRTIKDFLINQENYKIK